MKIRYESFSNSALGESHKKRGAVIQDASCHYESKNKEIAIAIVADGHGSSQYFRSEVGAQLATEVSLNGIKEFIFHVSSNSGVRLNNVEGERLLNGLAKNIIATWVNEVEKHVTDWPLHQDEHFEILSDKYKKLYNDDTYHQNFYHAYGTTLIAVAITKDFWFGMQIGDGKCVVLFDDGSWAQPIPWDDKCFLNETTSICDDNAISEFRYWFGSVKENDRRPIAMFIGTDGVDDTYPIHNNFCHLKNLYKAVTNNFLVDGYESTMKQIEDLVYKFAEEGSQDDVSIAGIIAQVPSKDLKRLLEQDDVRTEQTAM